MVYALQRIEDKMTIIIISDGADEFVYYDADKRRKKHDL